MKHIRLIAVLGALLMCCAPAEAKISLNLDTLATKGKFPRFVVNTYRWGNEFFNGYNEDYVVGTGYKFNAKVVSNTLFEYFNFLMPNKQGSLNEMNMEMRTNPAPTLGFYISYLAISLGYERDIKHFFSKASQARQRFTFGFNCAILSLNLYYINSHEPMTIVKFGKIEEEKKYNIRFENAHCKSIGFDFGYFFNHKKYSHAAAFSFSRIQQKSAGSFLAGLAVSRDEFDFDFNSLPAEITSQLPESWKNKRFNAENTSVMLRGGYGFNWVFAKRWLLGVVETPNVGIRIGHVNEPEKEKVSFGFTNQFKLSLVWNSNHFFVGAVSTVTTNLLYDKVSTFVGNSITANLTAGFRFNLW